MIMTLYHEEFGQGQPLLICHGFLGSSSNWRTVATKLASRFHVYTLDLRNHGLSFHHADCSYPAMAQDVLEFMYSHHLENPILLGHSMGGKVVMQLASDCPVSLLKLIVVDIAPKRYSDRHRQILDALSRLSLGDKSSLSELDQALSRDIADPALRKFLLKNCERNADQFAWKINLEGLRKDYDAIAAAPDLTEIIESPTLFVRGEKSDYIQLPDDERLIRKHFSDYRLKTISGSGHWVHVEAPALFMEVIDDFLCDI